MTKQQPDRSPEPGSAPISRRAAIRRVAAGSLAFGSAVVLTRRPARAQGNQDPALTEATARHAIDLINQVLATGEMSLLTGAFAPSYVNHTPYRSLTTGRLVRPDLTGLAASLTELRGVVPDAVLIVEEVIAAGDTVAVRGRVHGTLDPAVVDLPPGASQRVDIGGVAFARITDGLVGESWNYEEAVEVLGARSAPALEASPAAPAAEPRAEAGRGAVRAVSDFAVVSLHGVGTLVLAQGDTEALTIEAEPHVLARIDTRVEAGTLTIQPVESFETSEPIRYHLALKELTRLAVTGAGQVEAAKLTATDLRIELSGSAMVTIAGLAVTALDLVAAGSAELELAGTADHQTVMLSDASQYTATNLASRVAVVTVEAAAQATVAVSERLEAQVSGAGNIGYLGEPAVSQQVSEAGSVMKVG